MQTRLLAVERSPVFSTCKKNLYIGATFVVKLGIQELFAADHDSGRREKWHRRGVGIFWGLCVSITFKDAKALLIEAEGSERKCH